MLKLTFVFLFENLMAMWDCVEGLEPVSLLSGGDWTSEEYWLAGEMEVALEDVELCLERASCWLCWPTMMGDETALLILLAMCGFETCADCCCC